MIPAWLAFTAVLSFPGLVAVGYTAAHLLGLRDLAGARGLLLYLALLFIPLAAVLAHDPACAAGLLALPALWLLAGAAAGPALWWLQLALPGKTPDASERIYTGPPGPVGFLLVMIPVTLIVVAEEVVWRGFLQTHLTLAPAAAAFAAHHFFFGWRHLVFSFLAGLAWGLLFWASGSLWPPIVSHLLYNTLAWDSMRRMAFARNPPPPVSS
jgi:membrane protease YdiL (CAAX protease family)